MSGSATTKYKNKNKTRRKDATATYAHTPHTKPRLLVDVDSTPCLQIIRNSTMRTSYTCDDGRSCANLPCGNLDCLARSQSQRPSSKDGTTSGEQMFDDDEDSRDPESESDEHSSEGNAGSVDSCDSAISSCGIPAEVNVSVRENDDDSPRQCRDSTSEGEGSGVESDEELDPESDDEEGEEDKEGMGDDSSHGDLRSEDSEDLSSAPSSSEASHHELYLQRDASPSIQSLKYEEEDDSSESSDEEEGEQYSRWIYTVQNGSSGRPRMWGGCPASMSVSSNSSCSSSSRGSELRQNSDKSVKAGVSFSDDVTVYPVFPTAAYPPSVLRTLYTPREELRANKLRNKREFAHDGHSWREAAEEEDMEPNRRGELVHPVHGLATAPRKAVRTCSSAPSGCSVGSGMATGIVRRAKRMRMHQP